MSEPLKIAFETMARELKALAFCAENIASEVSDVDKQTQLRQLLTRQFEWSERTFGAGYPMARLFKHIRKELEEIESDPTDPVEWIDVALLALDGAWRCAGLTGERVAELFIAKMNKNRARKWGAVSGDEPTEHLRDAADEAALEREQDERERGLDEVLDAQERGE